LLVDVGALFASTTLAELAASVRETTEIRL